MTDYEMPVETAEQSLQRLRDRQHVWSERGFTVAVFLGFVLWVGTKGAFDEGWSWNMLWLPVAFVVYLLAGAAYDAIFPPVDRMPGGLFRAIFRPLSSRGYSYYDDDVRKEPAPDYSMAEVIVDEDNPRPLPEEEDRR
ncbi:MAG TPA: hypothetical protein VGC35_07505 [Allosphingosinicella sp.]